MNIDSVLFISCFFPAVLLLYWLIPGEKAGNLILLIAGLVFCAFGSIPSLLLLVLVAVINTSVISINRTYSPFGFQSLQGNVDGKNQEMTIWCVPIKTTS